MGWKLGDLIARLQQFDPALPVEIVTAGLQPWSVGSVYDDTDALYTPTAKLAPRGHPTKVTLELDPIDGTGRTRQPLLELMVGR